MPTKSELLIITSTEHMCDAELARLTDKARLVEWLQEDAPAELKSSVSPGMVPGELAAYSPDALESAIRETVGLLNGQAVFLAESNLTDVQRAGLKFLGEKLNSHLNHLLGAQLKRVTAHE